VDILTPSSDFRGKSAFNRRVMDILLTEGMFNLEHIRRGKVINEAKFSNGVVNVGKQYMLNAAFLGGTVGSTWFLGLIDGTAGTPILNDADSMAGHTGWSEFAYYDETVRQTWAKAIVTLNNTVASTGPAVFTIAATVPDGAFVAGGFLCNNNTKGGSTGTLWATGLHNNPVPVEEDDLFRLNYTTGL